MSTSLSSSILRSREVDFLTQERRLAQELGDCLRAFESSAEDNETLRLVTQALQEPFLLVIAGEFNAGKSAFINALVGEQALTEGVTPTTAHVTLLRYGETASKHLRPDGIEEIWRPSAFLKDTAIVDTPGTNAVLRHHEQLTSEFIPRSDFILFVTSADRPFTESERQFLERIRDWGKKIVLVLNKVDLLRDADETAEVMAFLRQHATALLGSTPEIFPVSARVAQQARRAYAGDDGIQLYERSRLGAVRDYLLRTLDDEGRTRLKLLTPLGVMQRLAIKYTEEAAKRQELLNEDARTVENIETQVAAHTEEMTRAFEQRLKAVENIVLQMRDRGDTFFDETVRLTNVRALIQRERMRQEFEQRVIGDAPAQLEAAVNELIDWLVEQEHRLWQNVNEYITRRRQNSASVLGTPGTGADEHIIGSVGATFDFNRRSVLQRVSIAANKAVNTYDRSVEAAELASTLQGAVTQTAVAGAGAVGLGVGIAVLIGTTAADITGITAGLALVGLGLGVIPYHRSRAKKQFDARTRELSETLNRTLREQFNREIASGKQRLEESLAPYTRFVRIESERVAQVKETLESLREQTRDLRQRIDGGDTVAEFGERAAPTQPRSRSA